MIIILIESLFMLHIPIDLLKTFLVTQRTTRNLYIKSSLTLICAIHHKIR